MAAAEVIETDATTKARISPTAVRFRCDSCADSYYTIPYVAIGRIEAS